MACEIAISDDCLREERIKLREEVCDHTIGLVESAIRLCCYEVVRAIKMPRHDHSGNAAGNQASVAMLRCKKNALPNSCIFC